MKTHYALHCRRRLASIAVFCCAGTPWSVSAQVSINVIALTGESTPITDTTYEVFDFPRINDAGKISFTALLTGPSVTEVNDHALFEVSNAAISPFQQTGSTLPTITPALVDSVGFPSLTNAGRFALLAGLYDDTAGERIGQALLSETPSGLSLIAREDTTILPGYAEPILALPVPNMNRAGHIAFRASV